MKEDQSLRFQAITQEKQHEDPIDRIRSDAHCSCGLADPLVSRVPFARSSDDTPAFKETIPDIPGKSLVGLVVTYPPGGATPAHSHPRSAFVTGYVLTGSIRSQVDHGKTQVFHEGEHWTESTGAYHPISENASATEPASLLAMFVVDTTDADRLVTYEQK